MSITSLTCAIPAGRTTTSLDVVQINATRQLPLKLNSSNYPSWHMQFDTLLTGLDLIECVNVTLPCPDQYLNNKLNPEYSKWIRQDKLILHSIVASVPVTVIPMIATSKTFHEAMTRLTKLFASKTRSRVMSLKKKLPLFTQGNKPVAEYLQSMSMSDDLALAQAPVVEDDLTICILNDLGPEFREMCIAISSKRECNLLRRAA